MNELQSRLDAEFAASGLKAAAYIRDIDTGEVLYDKDGGLVLPSASVIKVPLMLAVLNDVLCGRFALETVVPVREIAPKTLVFEYGPCECRVIELMHWMIINSDNTATNALIDLAGLERLDSFFTGGLGLRDTRLRRRMLDQKARDEGRENTLTHVEMADLFGKIFHDEILTPEACELARTILYRQRKQDQFMRYLYDLPMAHKTGSLKGLNADSGVLTLGKRRFYLGCTVYDQTTPEPDRTLTARFARIFVETARETGLC